MRRAEQLAAVRLVLEQPLAYVWGPPGTGKTTTIAAAVAALVAHGQRVLVVTHVRELIAQNHAEMLGLWPEAPAGIYSAGLGRRDDSSVIEVLRGAPLTSAHRPADGPHG